MKDKPTRKNLRSKEYDYNEAVYFVTLCTNNRRCLFGDFVGHDVIDMLNKER